MAKMQNFTVEEEADALENWTRDSFAKQYRDVGKKVITAENSEFIGLGGRVNVTVGRHSEGGAKAMLLAEKRASQMVAAPVEKSRTAPLASQKEPTFLRAFSVFRNKVEAKKTDAPQSSLSSRNKPPI